MKRFTGTLLDRAHSLLVSVPVTVLYAGTDDLADLFNDDLVPIGNPIVTDETGSFAFFIRSGVYDFIDANGIYLMKGVQIFDFLNPSEWTALWNFPPTGFIFGNDVRQSIYVSGDTILGTTSSWRVGGAQNGENPVLILDGANKSQPFLQGIVVATDDEPIFQVNYLGQIEWGPGGTDPVDIGLERVSAGRLGVTGDLEVTEEFSHQGDTLGFYGATPIAQPFVTTIDIDVVADESLYNLIVALNNFGLIRTEMVMLVPAVAEITGELAVSNIIDGVSGSSTVGTLAVCIGGVVPYVP